MFFFLNKKIFTFHNLCIFSESIDNQQPLFNLSRGRVDRGIVNGLLIFRFLIYSTCNFTTFER